MIRAAGTIVLLLALYTSPTRGYLTETPQNVAVLQGETVVLRCAAHAAPPSVRIMWTEYSTNPFGQVASDNRGITPSHPNAERYSIIGDEGSNEFFLQITDVTVADGGRYLCQDTLSIPPNSRGFAELVVLESDPRCRDYTLGSGFVLENLQYSGECEVNYGGNLAPVMEWRGEEGTFYTNGTNPPGSVWRYLSFTPTRQYEGLSYRCRTEFTTVPSQPDSATNIPDYTFDYFGPELVVVWLPTNITIVPDQAEYRVGDILTCYADSKPESSIQWTNMRTLEDFPAGSTLEITQDLEGTTQIMRCRAVIFYDGSIFSNDAYQNVTVPIITTTISTVPPVTTPPPADAPCHDLTGRWTSTNPSAILCVDVDSRGNLFTLIRNGTDLFFATGRGKTVAGDYKHIGFTSLWPTADAGTAGFAGECHNCFGTEVILMSGISRNKFTSTECGVSSGSHLTNLYVLTRSGTQCLGMTVDEVRTNQPWILDKMGVKAKKITPI